ncbi:MAG: hypothetical protein WCP39_06310 [Chlamydiota bacterium]
MRIGIDFDNTIVCYDSVFYTAALEKGLIPVSLSPAKGKIRDYLREIGKEDEWTKLQGFIYGDRMDLATPYEGVELFFQKMIPHHFLCIVSHKTKHPYLGPKYDLHQAAESWLKKQSFYSPSFPYYFLLTLQEKLKKIAEMQCDYFIDDLPELLLEKNFPLSTRKILFDPNHLFEEHMSYKKVSSWKELTEFLCLNS